MSKNFKNYPDPKLMLEKYGGDALRLYLVGSPVMKGEDILISEQAYKDQVRGIMLILWNVYKYFVTYANQVNFKPGSRNDSENILDVWMKAELYEFVTQVTIHLDAYDSLSAVSQYYSFIQDVSTWYIRRSRNRSTDQEFLQTLYDVLVATSKVMAPIAPFISEEIFRNLTGKESVHLENWPIMDKKLENENLIMVMNTLRKVVELGHKIRKQKNIKVRQPLEDMFYSHKFVNEFKPADFIDLLKEELNIKGAVIYSENPFMSTHKGTWGIETLPDMTVGLDLTITAELKAEGEMREIVRSIQSERKKLGTKLDEQIAVSLPSWPKEWEEEIKKKALVKNLSKGEFKVLRIESKNES